MVQDEQQLSCVPPGFGANRCTNDEGYGDASGEHADGDVQVSVGLLLLRELLLGVFASIFFSGDVAEQGLCPWGGDDEHQHGEGYEDEVFHRMGENEKWDRAGSHTVTRIFSPKAFRWPSWYYTPDSAQFWGGGAELV